MLLGADGVLSVGRESIELGESVGADFEPFGYELRPGEALLIFVGDISDTTPTATLAAETAVANVLEGKHRLSAAELVAESAGRSHCTSPRP